MATQLKKSPCACAHVAAACGTCMDSASSCALLEERVCMHRVEEECCQQ